MISRRPQQASQEAMRASPPQRQPVNATLRTTCVATQLEGGHAVNALPQLAAATVNCRVLPEDSAEYVQSTLQKVVADDQVSIKMSASRPQVPPRPCARTFRRHHRVTEQNLARSPHRSHDGHGRHRRQVSRASPAFQPTASRDFSSIATTSASTAATSASRVQSFYEGQAFLYDLVKT